MDSYPAIDINPKADIWNQVRKINAQLTYFMGIPFPEELDDDTWMEKYRQFQYLSETDQLPVKFEK